MDFNKARDELKPRLREYVESITTKSKGGAYVCPICGSGKGEHRTGAFSVDPKNPTRWKCFKCGKGGDIFDLIGEVEHITEPLAQLQRAGELYGVDLQSRGTHREAFRKENQNQPKTERGTHTDMGVQVDTYTQTDTAGLEDCYNYIEKCKARLAEPDYHTRRGISDTVAKNYWLGYDPHYTEGTGGKAWKALIIPTSLYSYVARNTDPNAGASERYRKSKGSTALLNSTALQTAKKPVFIVEGELDALSVIEAGGEAVGLGSASNTYKLLDHVKKQMPTQPLILALDNDEAGKKATDELAKKLDELGVPYHIADPYNGQKDANSALMADRVAFSMAIEKAEHFIDEELEAERDEYLSTSTYCHLKDFRKRIADSVNTPAIPTGFKTLDAILDGGLYEGLYILGAITSLGKTTIALQIADQIAQQGKDVLIFSLEMARAELMSKSISRHTLQDVLENGGDERNAKTNRGITAGSRYAGYTQTERDLIERAILAYGEYAQHIFIHEGIGDIGTDEVREIVRKHQLFTGRTPVVLVDYVQILAPYNVRATDKQNVDRAVLELKRISRDYKIPVIGISSFNRASYKEAVTLEAFKESGSLEYGSDVLIGLQLKGAGRSDFDPTEAKKKDPREIELVILKNRNGRTGGRIGFDFYAMFNYFAESDAAPVTADDTALSSKKSRRL